MALTPLTSLVSSRAAPSEWFVPGRYLTDGRRLFCVVSQIDNGEQHRFASLEDCLTLELRSYLPGELVGMGLRPVRTAAS